MNDHYKEIAVAASEWCEQHAQGTPVAWEWEKKYAQMVVQECISEIALYGIANFENKDVIETTHFITKIIKEKFGIK